MSRVDGCQNFSDEHYSELKTSEAVIVSWIQKIAIQINSKELEKKYE